MKTEKSETLVEAGSGKLRTLLNGVVLILFSNIIYIANNYFVKFMNLKATDILLVRGLTQVLIFSALILVFKWRERKSEENSSKDPEVRLYTVKNVACLVIYSVLMATISYACIAAIPLMPIGDLIVISFASPAFSVFLTRVFLGTKLTLLSVALSALILVGDVLVVQPPFIFGGGEYHSDYYLGVTLCFYVAVVAAVADIFSTLCSKAGISTHMLMLGTGIASIVVSLAAFSFKLDDVSEDLAELIQIQNLMYAVASALGVMLAFWAVAVALAITRNPTLVSMLRCTEILISLGTESVINQHLPNILSFSGSTLVLVCVLSMSVHDRIFVIIKKWKGDDVFTICNKGKGDDKAAAVV